MRENEKSLNSMLFEIPVNRSHELMDSDCHIIRRFAHWKPCVEFSEIVPLPLVFCKFLWIELLPVLIGKTVKQSELLLNQSHILTNIGNV